VITSAAVPGILVNLIFLLFKAPEKAALEDVIIQGRY
jgi:hypothetical protein